MTPLQKKKEKEIDCKLKWDIARAPPKEKTKLLYGGEIREISAGCMQEPTLGWKGVQVEA